MLCNRRECHPQKPLGTLASHKLSRNVHEPNDLIERVKSFTADNPRACAGLDTSPDRGMSKGDSDGLAIANFPRVALRR